MPVKYDVVIIGSGLGGLLCGNILSKEGFNVCVLEKNHKLGGSLQTFGRKAVFFNTGLNYTESLDNGQVLNQYFRYFGIIDKLKLRRLDSNGFDVISFNDEKYNLAMGKENFIETLLKSFPKEKEGLTNYIKTITDICSSISFYTFTEDRLNIFENNFLGKSASDFISSNISDQRLQNILAGTNLLYAGVKNKTPLFTLALINNSFIESAWRIEDGSHNMVKFLADNITANNGMILRNAKAEKFFFDGGKIKAVQLQTGEMIEASKFISNIHPSHILDMVEPSMIKPSFSARINGMEDTMGMFTLYLVFKKNKFPYLNYNFYHFNQDDVWIAGDYNKEKWPQNYVLLCTATSKSDKYAESASVITYMNFDELLKWEKTFTGKRGNDYLEFKKEKAELLLRNVEKQFPGIQESVEAYYTSTPLTWRDYTGTRAGSAYGVLKDYNRPLESVILPKTKIPNLYLTGQNVNLHGILGVTISSVITCAELIDIKYLIKKIKSA